MGSAADGPSPSFHDPIATFIEGSRHLTEELDRLTDVHSPPCSNGEVGA